MAEPTLRFRCLESIRTSLASLVEDPPADDPYSVQFSAVEHGPLGDFNNRKRYVAAVVPGRESKHTRYPLNDCTLPVTIEFRMAIDRGDQRPLVEAERVPAKSSAASAGTVPWAGWRSTCTRPATISTSTPMPTRRSGGAVFLEVRYRHATDDPRAAV